MYMFQRRNDFNDKKTDVIFYRDTTIDRLVDVVYKERKNSYAVYHWLTQSKTYINWPGFSLVTPHHRKRVVQVGPTEGTIYNVQGYFKEGKKINALKCCYLSSAICVALKMKIIPEITNYSYFIFYSRFLIVTVLHALIKSNTCI